MLTNRREFLKTSIAGVATTPMLPSLLSYGKENSENKRIQAFCVDFNWDQPGFAVPGRWADVNPAASVKWHKELGCNAIVTFAASCNGYAWYKNGFVPEQPGLKYDFLTDMVRLGHKENMKVFGYFCFGANTLWGKENPKESYGTPTSPHIPFTKHYLDYLCQSIADAFEKTGMDGLRIDWFWNPQNSHWLECEQQMYRELMDETFHGNDKVTKEQAAEYRKRALNRAWKQMYETVKSIGKDKIVWHSINNLNHPDIQGDNILMLEQPDWLTNEAGDLKSLRQVASRVGKQTRLVTCMASWNKQDVVKTINEIDSSGLDVGLYGFTKPLSNGLPLPISEYLSKPTSEYSGDAKNLAVFARVFNGLALDYVKKL